MRSFIQYDKDLEIQQRAFEEVQRTVDAINAVFMTSFDGTEGGVPRLAGLPITKGMAKAISDYEKAKSFHDKDLNFEILTSHWKNIYRAISTLKRELPLLVIKQLKRVEKNKNIGLIPHRNFEHCKDCAQIVRKLITDFPKSGARYSELAHEFPDMAEVIPKRLDKISRIWPGLIELSPENETVVMNAIEYERYKMLIYDFDGITKTSKKTLDESRSYFAMLLHTVDPLIKDKVSKLFLREEWMQFVNRPIDDYGELIPKRISGMLKNHNIFTALDFLKQNYFWAKGNLAITKEHRIDIYLGLASRLKFDCREFSIQIVHKSLFEGQPDQAMAVGYSMINGHFENSELKYKDIISCNDIIINDDKNHCRNYSYRIIAFIRWFYSKCISAGITTFQSMPKDWKYDEYLTGTERVSLKLIKHQKHGRGYNSIEKGLKDVSKIDGLQKITNMELVRLTADGGSEDAKK